MKVVFEKLDLASAMLVDQGAHPELRFGGVGEEPDKDHCEDDEWGRGRSGGRKRALMHGQWKRVRRQRDHIQS